MLVFQGLFKIFLLKNNKTPVDKPKVLLKLRKNIINPQKISFCTLRNIERAKEISKNNNKMIEPLVPAIKLVNPKGVKTMPSRHNELQGTSIMSFQNVYPSPLDIEG